MLLATDIIRILNAGGGVRVDCQKRLSSDILRMATAAVSSDAILILENTNRLLVSDKVRISMAGKGHVIFNDIV